MRLLRVALLAVALILAVGLFPIATWGQAGTTFQIFMDRFGPEPKEHLFSFRFSRALVADPIGTHRWWDGDRISYHTAYVFAQHEDPMNHPLLTAFRIMFQQYGTSQGILNDQGMVENPFGDPDGESQGLAPYPYELVPALPTDRSRPGAVVDFVHWRPRTSVLLWTWEVPAVDPLNAKVRWYYQLGGLIVGEYDGAPFLRIILAAMHPAYTYSIRGVPTQDGR